MFTWILDVYDVNKRENLSNIVISGTDIHQTFCLGRSGNKKLA